ncbi:1-(5-phosphoribosyl)-5-[(5-phosphoribosylamino)methylideneamino]imidazole-4-carboxamide isomerase [Geomicrobium sp. JSM 1781026]|uniref:1-(5-phosphoribosyl)-5-[(5- phosphoribosylamino)methylideneamino]imidazole-4- carboxamide isomerase n=1 Tax=Geomicrobium sp. JSM 1781026 TaxID=3344580 RepID=UPI0035C0576F
MSFDIYPAIDVRGGNCVRLKQGNYDDETIYHDSPLTVAREFEQAGAKWVHIVDLDGAREKKPVNHEKIIEVIRHTNLSVQIGGGIRTASDIEDYLQAGAARVILGSVAISNPTFAKEMLSKYPGQIVIGLDARNGHVAVNGWLESSEAMVEDVAREMHEAGALTFIFTDIQKDGMMEGPNIEANEQLARASGAGVITSGGVSTLSDVRKLLTLQGAGVVGAIIGKALYTGAIDLEEALKEVAESCSQSD